MTLLAYNHIDLSILVQKSISKLDKSLFISLEPLPIYI